MGIPSGISEILLPQDNLNVVDLIGFTISVGKNSAPDLLAIPDTELFSKIESRITGEEHVVFLHALAVPTAMEVQMVQERLETVSENEVDEEKSKSLVYPLSSPTSPNVRLPFWVLEYWSKAHTVIEEKNYWSPAIAWLKRQQSHQAINLLRDIPWKYRSPDPELDNALDIHDLALFCSEAWLRTAQMDTMSAVLNDQLASNQIHASVQPNNFFQKLLAMYRFGKDNYPTHHSTSFIRRLADDLKGGVFPVACTAIAVRLTRNGPILPEGQETPSNHWCALIINITQRTLHYGDPMGSPPPEELANVMGWWLGLSFTEPFTFQSLPITRQIDSFSCSILTMNALAHFFIPSIPLLMHGPLCLLARTDMLIRAINLLKKRDPAMISSSSNTQSYTSMASASSFHPTEGKMVSEKKTKTERKKGTEKDKTKQKGVGRGKEKAVFHVPQMFQATKAKKVPTNEPGPSKTKPEDDDNDDRSDDEKSLRGSEGEDESVVADLESLIDIKKATKSTTALTSRGRPANSLIDDLVQQCYHISRPEKHLFRCLGLCCGKTYANRNLKRIVRHASGCSKLSGNLRRQAKAHLANQAPSRKLPIDDPESTKVQEANSDTEAKEKGGQVDGTGRVVAVKKRKVAQTDWFEDAKKLGRNERHRKLNLAVVKLICVSGIPTHITDLDVWKDLFNYADPSYKPATRAILEESEIIGDKGVSGS